MGVAIYNQWDKKNKEVSVVKEEEKAPIGLEPKQTAPDFILKSLQDENVQLSGYKGKKVMINFWATWCPPCRVEIPELNKFYENKNENEEILAVNLTTTETNASGIQGFVQDYSMNFPILLDESGTVSQTYMAASIPTSYFIDSNGHVYYKHTGPLTESQVRDIFDDMK